ncbi:sodium channel subunit beta-2-like [Sinocyclocheilus grahami]|uniref:sodium channel subunit beta-2-like n=1 Tax=Sinocyclocheilus grahami TaxID=75366 RepID=UPI0007AD4851|nr:PREDICTED: sodium channel subunit beta-2-like [Sinocyclocheilus grahami]XP_016144208.1 PREDICTED: sodium channel subunit beta-2-like [Sinocyclocheilus grahami]XP_016144209.1 PREDICTED: sodium channel subunit beta-2-like [Sinocyclocheilus grahami]XP_016144210.1 PREDICTED: sodium channel subunit beta-2-like [Sinocyclocheilus grahami]
MKPLALLALLLIMSGSAVGQTLKSNATGFVGKDVLLSFNCFNVPKELIWQKGDRVVNAHSQDKINIDDSYVDRTQLFLNEEKRNCSLLLRNISTADAGLYTCHALDSVDNNIWSKESTEVNLTVESNPEKVGQTEEESVTAVSVSVPIAVVVLILAVILLLILLNRRQHRTNTDTDDLPIEKPMLQNV